MCPYDSQAPSLLIEQWKPLDPEGKKQYDREFLLDFQFMPACIQKPEGLPPISDVVLDKVRGEPIKQVRAGFLFQAQILTRCTAGLRRCRALVGRGILD